MSILCMCRCRLRWSNFEKKTNNEGQRDCSEAQESFNRRVIEILAPYFVGPTNCRFHCQLFATCAILFPKTSLHCPILFSTFALPIFPTFVYYSIKSLCRFVLLSLTNYQSENYYPHINEKSSI